MKNILIASLLFAIMPLGMFVTIWYWKGGIIAGAVVAVLIGIGALLKRDLINYFILVNAGSFLFLFIFWVKFFLIR